MPTTDELGAQLVEVVDLAVQDNGQRAVLVEDRLLSVGYVDDREALHPEGHAAIVVEAAFVRPAMHHGIAHRVHRARIDCAPEVDLPCYSAHLGNLRSVRL